MDNDNSSKALGLQQQMSPVEYSPSDSSSGWGTCSELLLVSAVKKHGVPNWNLVALELKACAIRLNMSPSCFSEEACKFKYNALKVKFANNNSSSSSSSSGDVLDDDLSTVSWFEELRKLRMSHLKEELRVYDSSIGQLQSRISRLKEERAQHQSLQSVMKQCECSCGGMDPHMNGCEALDVKNLTAESCPSEPVVLESVVQGDLSEQVIDGLDGCASISPEGNCLLKDATVCSIPNFTVKDSPGDLLRIGDLTTEIWGSDTVELDGKVTKGVDDGDCKIHLGRFLVKGDTCGGQEPDVTSQPSNSDQTTRTSMSVSGDESLPQDIVETGVDGGSEKQGNQENVGEQIQELENSDEGASPHPFSASMISNREVDAHEDGLLSDSPETLGLTSVVLERAPEGEDTCMSRSNVDSVMEFGHSGRSLTFRRAEKEKRMKARDSVQLRQILGPELELRDGMDDQLSKISGEAAEICCLEGKEENDTPVLMDQSELSRLDFDHMPFNCMEVGPMQEEVPSCPNAGCTEKALESAVLDDDKRLIPTGTPSSKIDLLARSSSFERDLLPIASGPKPNHLLAGVSEAVPSVDLHSIPDTSGEQEFLRPGCAEFEPGSNLGTPHGMQSTCPLNEMGITPKEGKFEEEHELCDAVNIEGESLKVEQEAGQDVEEVYMSNDCVEAQRLQTDHASSRSLGDDISETVDGDVQDESRDAPEINGVQQQFPDCADSQIDKSEVGSSMDSVEDMSPSSRKNRREPRVPGKFLPLLECLRVICGHKFAPLFKQRQEHQDNAHYDRLVRRHVDLSIVRTRLEEGAYSSSVEFFRDLLLIFTNALVCNSSDSPEYVGAKALRSCALIEMDKILQTEALLKQNGPATRKREVKRSMEVHKMRISSTSGSEGRKRGILKSTNENAALDFQGGGRSAHIAFDHVSPAGRSPNSNEDRELDHKIATYKKLTVNRSVKEETLRKELQKPELLQDGEWKESKKPEFGLESRRKESLKPGLLIENKRKELQKPGILNQGKRKDSQKPGLFSDSRGKEFQKPGLIREGKQKESQKPRLISDGRQKESQKSGHLGEGKSKEVQKSGLHGEGRPKDSQKPTFHSEGRRREFQKPALLNDGKCKELQSPDFLNEGRRKDLQKSELFNESKRKECQKPDLPTETKSGVPSTFGKKMKVDGAARKASSECRAIADARENGGQSNVDNVGSKTSTAKMKDVMCIDGEEKLSLKNSSNLGSAGLPSKKQQNPSILRQNSTSRVSRYSKRGGESTVSNPNKRARK